jgi:hypothetical protein
LERRSRVDPFATASLQHADRLQLLFVIQGTREVVIEGEAVQLGVADLLVLPGGVECDDRFASEEHEAVRIHLLA